MINRWRTVPIDLVKVIMDFARKPALSLDMTLDILSYQRATTDQFARQMCIQARSKLRAVNELYQSEPPPDPLYISALLNQGFAMSERYIEFALSVDIYNRDRITHLCNTMITANDRIQREVPHIWEQDFSTFHGRRLQTLSYWCSFR